MEEIYVLQVERVAPLLAEGGKLLNRACFPKDSQIFNVLCKGDEPRQARQISDDLQLLATTSNDSLREIVKGAREVLIDYYNKSSSTIRRRGVPQNLLRKYVSFLNRFYSRYSPYNTDASNHHGKIFEIIRKLESYGIRESLNSKNMRPHDRSSWQGYDTKGEKFVGLTSDIKLLVERLLMNEINIVGICGIGGLGKSALSREILKDPNIRRHFSGFAWIDMRRSKEESKKILTSILSCLNPTESQMISSWSKMRIIKELIQVQKSKNCLFVLDDMWSGDLWGTIKEAFVIESGTKLLVTTRDRRLVSFVDKGAYIYQQRYLNEKESLELFSQRLKYLWEPEIQTQQELENMEHIGRNMISRFGGLPFLIVTVTKLMSVSLGFEEREIARQIIESYTIGDIDMWCGTLAHVLDFSYEVLSKEQRLCLLYLCNLPEEYEIDAEKLFLLWTAEDLIPIEHDKSPMDVAESYLREFDMRNMVQVKIDESNGRTKSVSFHECFQDLCLSKSNPNYYLVCDMRSSDNLVKRVPEIFSPTDDTSLDIGNDRVAICLQDQGNLEKYVPFKREIAKEVRSELFFFQNYRTRSKISHMVQSHLSDLKKVRVLDLGGLVFSKLDSVIGKMIDLRYLGLRYTVFHKLPSSIANLQHLQTLDIRDDDTQYAAVIIPDVLWKMKQLKHLFLRTLMWTNKERHDKLHCNDITSLEIFEHFDSRAFNVKDLSSLKKLIRLRATVCKLQDLNDFTEYLHNNDSPHLRDLSLLIKYCDLYSEDGLTVLDEVFKCPILYELSIDGRTGKLPMYVKEYSYCLTKITLQGCQFKDDPMKMLENFPNLRSLFLKWYSFLGNQIVCSAKGFPQLRILELRQMRDLETWVIEEGAMPKFYSLEIFSCPSLQMLPNKLELLEGLKKVVIGRMPESFTSRLRRLEDGTNGEDLHKVQHASITIISYGGKVETVYGDKYEATGEWVVNKEAAVSSTRETNRSKTIFAKQKGKAPITKSSAISEIEDDDNGHNVESLARTEMESRLSPRVDTLQETSTREVENAKNSAEAEAEAEAKENKANQTGYKRAMQAVGGVVPKSQMELFQLGYDIGLNDAGAKLDDPSKIISDFWVNFRKEEAASSSVATTPVPAFEAAAEEEH